MTTTATSNKPLDKKNSPQQHPYYLLHFLGKKTEVSQRLTDWCKLGKLRSNNGQSSFLSPTLRLTLLRAQLISQNKTVLLHRPVLSPFHPATLNSQGRENWAVKHSANLFGSGISRSEVKSWPCCFLYMWLMECCFTFLSFSFLI